MPDDQKGHIGQENPVNVGSIPAMPIEKKTKHNEREDRKMTYTEFYDKYKFATKHYPGISSLLPQFDRESITEKREYYQKKGSRWILERTEIEDITAEYYFNALEAVPFFRRIGSERVEMRYTKAGYVPTVISSISPDGQTKVKRTYTF